MYHKYLIFQAIFICCIFIDLRSTEDKNDKEIPIKDPRGYKD